MAHKSTPAVAYYRASSAANVGADKDTLARQQAAVRAYAKANGIEVVAEFYDPAVSGADPIDQRPGFTDLLNRTAGDGVSLVLVEDASRFATAARRLARKPPKGKRPSLRTIAAGLKALGHLGPSGEAYGPESIKRMLNR